MAGLIGSEGTPFSITFDNPDATSLGLMVGKYGLSLAVKTGTEAHICP